MSRKFGKILKLSSERPPVALGCALALGTAWKKEGIMRFGLEGGYDEIRTRYVPIVEEVLTGTQPRVISGLLQRYCLITVCILIMNAQSSSTYTIHNYSSWSNKKEHLYVLSMTTTMNNASLMIGTPVDRIWLVF